MLTWKVTKLFNFNLIAKFSIIQTLIRFINEFWFITDINKDDCYNKLNLEKSFANRVKVFKDCEELLVLFKDLKPY